MKRPFLTIVASATLVIQALAQDATVKDFQVAAFKEFKPLEKDGWKKDSSFILNVNQGALRNWALP